MSWTKILGIHSDKWDNPKESTGELVGPLRGGRYRCWEATGRARQIFQELSSEIKDYLEALSIPPSDTVSWSIYMIGRTKETAAPKILICSTDIKTRKEIRKLIKDSKIIAKYPGMGLGDVSVLPDRQIVRALSRQAIQALLPFGCSAEGAVLAERSKPHLGTRLFTVNVDDFSLRPATAGPMMIQNGKYYQLTVAHAFQHQNHVHASLHNGVAADDCDFDGMSDDEDGEGPDNDIARTGSATPEFLDSEKGSFTGNIDMISSIEGSDVWFRSPTRGDLSGAQDSESATKHATTTSSESHGLDTSQLRYYGKLALSSMDGDYPSLDYALIEIAADVMEEVEQASSINRVPGSSQILAIGKDEPGDTDIMAATSHYLVTGRLTATPCYVRLPGQTAFQKVYPTRLKKPLVDGDCGSAIIGKENGSYYGQIVAGGPGTCVALFVSANDIVKDIEARSGCKLSLAPGSAGATPQRGSSHLSGDGLYNENSTISSKRPTGISKSFGNTFTRMNNYINTQKPELCSICNKPSIAHGDLCCPYRSDNCKKLGPRALIAPASDLGKGVASTDSAKYNGPSSMTMLQTPQHLGWRHRKWERERSEFWEDERENFPQFCMTCEKQFVPHGDMCVYCSDSCRKIDQTSMSQHASSIRSYASGNYPFYSAGNPEPKNIIPHASPSQPMSTHLGSRPITPGGNSAAYQHTSAISALRSLDIRPPSPPSSTDCSSNLWPLSRNTDRSPHDSHCPSTNYYQSGFDSGVDRPLPPRRPDAYSRPKTIELITPAVGKQRF